MNARRREMTFIVRMWLPEDSRSQANWRGSVHEIVSGKRLFVTGPRDVADFIAMHLDEPAATKD